MSTPRLPSFLQSGQSFHSVQDGARKGQECCSSRSSQQRFAKVLRYCLAASDGLYAYHREPLSTTHGLLAMAAEGGAVKSGKSAQIIQ